MTSRRSVLVAVGLAALLALVAAAPFIPRPDDSAEYAAWAQGIGTIVAVAVAAWVGLLPIEAAEKARRETQQRFLDAAAGARLYEEKAAQALTDAAHSGRDRVIALLMFGDTMADAARPMKALLAEPYPSWPSAELYIATLTLVDNLDALRATANQMSAMAADFVWEEGERKASAERNLKTFMSSLTHELNAIDKARDVVDAEIFRLRGGRVVTK